MLLIHPVQAEHGAADRAVNTLVIAAEIFRVELYFHFTGRVGFQGKDLRFLRSIHRQNAEAEDLRLSVDEAILALFGGKISTVFDADTGLTYIILGNINFTPPKAVPAYGPLGSEQEKENATYRNPNYIKPDAEEETPYGDKTEVETVSAPDKDSDHAEVSDQATMTQKR